MIFSGQITKEQALNELSLPPYDIKMMEQDKEYIAKKLNFSDEEFDKLLELPNRNHNEFGDEIKIENMVNKIVKTMKPIKPFMKWALGKKQ